MYVLQRADAEKSPCSWHEVTESVCHSCPGRRDSTKATVRVHNLGVHDGMMTRCGQLGCGRWLREGAAPVVPSPPPACMLRGAGGVPTPAAWQRAGGASIETLSPALQHGTTCGWGERSTLAARAATPLLGRRGLWPLQGRRHTRRHRRSHTPRHAPPPPPTRPSPPLCGAPRAPPRGGCPRRRRHTNAEQTAAGAAGRRGGRRHRRGRGGRRLNQSRGLAAACRGRLAK